MRSVRLVIANDHLIFLQGLKAALEGNQQLKVVGEAAGGNAALDLVETLRPDVLILDVEMPDMSSIEVVKQLRERNIAVHVLVLSAYSDTEYIRRLLQEGVAGYVLKDEAAEMVVQAVEAVARGETGWFSRKVVSQIDRVVQRDLIWKDLTNREIQVLRELALGKSNVDIGHTLHISEKTVEKHLDNIYRKLGVASRTQAAVIATQRGLLDENPDLGLA